MPRRGGKMVSSASSARPLSSPPPTAARGRHREGGGSGPTIAEQVVEQHAGWPGPWVEDDVFGSHDPAALEAAVTAFCRAELGAVPTACRFYAVSVGCVFGLVLDDGRGVVVKAHQPKEPADFLAAAAQVQAAVASRGFPCPRPLLEPRPLGLSLATVEELVERGRHGDAHRPPIRRAMAATLARLVEQARDLADVPGLRAGLLSRPKPGSLWPEPHSPIFDFEATAAGAEWIDHVAAHARERLADPAGDRVVGHVDWSVKHFRFAGGRVRVVYDWDSVALVSEPALVGSAARSFTASWNPPARPLMPTFDEARAFVAEYEAARGRLFGRAEYRTLGAAAAYSLAYGARCEHASAPGSPLEPGGQRDALLRHGEAFLAL